MTLLDMAKAGVWKNEKSFTRPDDDWLPILITRAGTTGYITPLDEVFSDKDVAAEIITEILKELGAAEAVLITSAWIVDCDDGKWDGTPPSEHPDRQEVLVLTHVDTETAHLEIAKITREEGKPPKLGEFQESMSGLGVHGRFADAMRLGIG